jgi:hypothetical protein
MSECTKFKDRNGKFIYSATAVEFWDEEGGYGVGIVTLVNGEWCVVNPEEMRVYGWSASMIMVKNFSPKGIKCLGFGV